MVLALLENILFYYCRSCLITSRYSQKALLSPFRGEDTVNRSLDTSPLTRALK